MTVSGLAVEIRDWSRLTARSIGACLGWCPPMTAYLGRPMESITMMSRTSEERRPSSCAIDQQASRVARFEDLDSHLSDRRLPSLGMGCLTSLARLLGR